MSTITEEIDRIDHCMVKKLYGYANYFVDKCTRNRSNYEVMAEKLYAYDVHKTETTMLDIRAKQSLRPSLELHIEFMTKSKPHENPWH